MMISYLGRVSGFWRVPVGVKLAFESPYQCNACIWIVPGTVTE